MYIVNVRTLLSGSKVAKLTLIFSIQRQPYCFILFCKFAVLQWRAKTENIIMNLLYIFTKIPFCASLRVICCKFCFSHFNYVWHSLKCSLSVYIFTLLQVAVQRLCSICSDWLLMSNKSSRIHNIEFSKYDFKPETCSVCFPSSS